MQLSLLSGPSAAFDPRFTGLQRTWLDETAWVDHLPGWLSSSETLFDELVRTCDWRQRERWMYEKRVLEPRLTTYWLADWGLPLRPPIVEQMREALGALYGVVFDSVGFNLYRDGSDSVAWHGDRIGKELTEPVVVLVSLGEARRFLLRPKRPKGAKSGGPSVKFALGSGDLLVTGGRTQRTWEHSVPKVARAGPRISLAFRHGMSPGAYGGTSGGSGGAKGDTDLGETPPGG